MLEAMFMFCFSLSQYMLVRIHASLNELQLPNAGSGDKKREGPLASELENSAFPCQRPGLLSGFYQQLVVSFPAITFV